MGINRREVLQSLGMAGAGLALGCGRWGNRSNGAIARLVASTALIDTHEHLPDEVDRLAGHGLPCNDWSLLFHDYLSEDLLSAGMSREDHARFFSPGLDPLEKWPLLEPFWTRVRHTGFAQAVRISMQALYGIDALSAATIPRLQAAYEELRAPGFYEKILRGSAHIESCQVNTQGVPFHESRQPGMLMQDLSFQNLHIEPDVEELSSASGIEVASLGGWHDVIRWWFAKYANFAVAAKSQGAYLRGLNYRRVEPEEAEPLFDRFLSGEQLPREELKILEDHLFWFCVDQATEHRLPVKIHTGYLAGQRLNQFRRITQHTPDIIELCNKGPATSWVFLHMGYPNWQELIAVVKKYPNAYAEMSWAWAIDPASAREFLKRLLVAAPANKVFPFGGDYSVVECVLGHAVMARRGITRALEELVADDWLSEDDAIDMVEPLLLGNASQFFRLQEKTKFLSQVPWL
jgi:predicted TIM-barrel fold metal-dependent hydrolase